MFIVLKKLVQNVKSSVVEPGLRALVGDFLDGVSVRRWSAQFAVIQAKKGPSKCQRLLPEVVPADVFH